MPENRIISLGGIPILLSADLADVEYDREGRAPDFYSPLTPEISLNIHCGGFPDVAGWRVQFDTEVNWQLLQVDRQYAIKCRNAFQDPFLLGIFPADFLSGDIFTSLSIEQKEHYIFPFSHPLGELYMMNLLGTHQGLLVHAAGVIDQGKGYLFVGHGSAGKTTTARLWQGMSGVQVVNDDKVIVRKQDGSYLLYGTPWHGQGGMASPESAPIERIFILKQANENHADPLPPAAAASLLLVRSFVPLWDADKMAASIDFLDGLCQSVPCFRLSFLPDHSLVDFVRSL